jgi:hypothetical protein
MDKPRGRKTQKSSVWLGRGKGKRERYHITRMEGEGQFTNESKRNLFGLTM